MIEDYDETPLRTFCNMILKITVIAIYANGTLLQLYWWAHNNIKLKVSYKITFPQN